MLSDDDDDGVEWWNGGGSLMLLTHSQHQTGLGILSYHLIIIILFVIFSITSLPLE